MRVYNAVTSPMEGVPLFIPGAGVDTYTGELLGRSIARVDIGLEAVASELTPAIIFSGGKANGAADAEAIAMDKYLTHHAPAGVPIPRRFLETEAERSIQNLAFSVPFFRQAGVFEGSHMDLSVVTDPVHMPRLIYIASKILPEEVRLHPVFSRYEATEYDIKREKIAGPVTKATLAGLADGSGPDKALARERRYAQVKGSAKQIGGMVRRFR